MQACLFRRKEKNVLEEDEASESKKGVGRPKQQWRLEYAIEFPVFKNSISFRGISNYTAIYH